jgi:hypothetical protein
MNPQVACRFCEFEKHLLEPSRTTVGDVLRRGDAIADIVRMVVIPT